MRYRLWIYGSTSARMWDIRTSTRSLHSTVKQLLKRARGDNLQVVVKQVGVKFHACRW